ncbi:MAG: YdcF family protein [Blastocatellia bacterium]
MLIVSACLLAGYFLTPVVLNEAAEGLIREDQLVKADVIVALGGDNRCNREKRAAELYRQGWANNVVVSGLSYAWGFHTGEAARAYVMNLGVPAEKISMISETLNTRAEAKALDELMRERGWNSAIIVTSAFHSRRATYTIEKAARGRAFHSSPVPAGSPEWEPRAWWSRRSDVFLTVREFMSWANTLVNGWQ